MDTVTAQSGPGLHGEHAPGTGNEEGEEEQREKKPVMKKVKDKVKKIKNAITKKSHGHGDLDEGDDGFVEGDAMMEDPAVHGAPMYESSAIGMRTGAKEVSGGRGGEGSRTIEFVDDPAAPKIEVETKARIEQSRVGKEAEFPPELRRSSEGMAISTENDRGETGLSKDNNSSYTEMVSSAASKVYGMVADAGAAVVSKVKPDVRKNGEDQAAENQGKGLSIKEYITEKLTPGEDEKALSELITEFGQKKKNETVEVPRQEGTGLDEGGSGAGVVDRLRETVTSLLGGGESSKSPATEAHVKVAGDDNDFHR